MKPPVAPLLPPRQRWGKYWDPATGRQVWGCVGPACPIQQTSLGLGQDDMSPETRRLFQNIGLGSLVIGAASIYAIYRLVRWEERRS